MRLARPRHPHARGSRDDAHVGGSRTVVVACRAESSAAVRRNGVISRRATTVSAEWIVSHSPPDDP